MMAVLWSKTSTAFRRREAGCRELDTSTATTGYPGKTLWAMRTGKLATNPPSRAIRPSTGQGSKKPGMDMEARSADARLPRRSNRVSPVSMSVATATKGTGKSSKLLTRARAVSWCRVKRRRFPSTIPKGPVERPRLSKVRRSRLWASLFAAVAEGDALRSSSRDGRSMPRTTSSSEAPSYPEARSPPMMAPMLVPTMPATGMPARSST